MDRDAGGDERGGLCQSGAVLSLGVVASVVRATTQVRCDNPLDEYQASIDKQQAHSLFDRPVANTFSVSQDRVLLWLQLALR